MTLALPCASALCPVHPQKEANEFPNTLFLIVKAGKPLLKKLNSPTEAVMPGKMPGCLGSYLGRLGDIVSDEDCRLWQWCELPNLSTVNSTRLVPVGDPYSATLIQSLHRGRAVVLFRTTPPPSTQSPVPEPCSFIGQKRARDEMRP